MSFDTFRIRFVFFKFSFPFFFSPMRRQTYTNHYHTELCLKCFCVVFFPFNKIMQVIQYKKSLYCMQTAWINFCFPFFVSDQIKNLSDYINTFGLFLSFCVVWCFQLLLLHLFTLTISLLSDCWKKMDIEWYSQVIIYACVC